MKDKKILLLIFLTLFWLVSLLKGNNQKEAVRTRSQVTKPKRITTNREDKLPIDYEKFQRRKEIVLNRESNLFQLPMKREQKVVKVEITEEELILRELDKIEFIGLISSASKQTLYLEYQNEILEGGDGTPLQIHTKDNSYDILFTVEDDIMTISETTYSLEREINI